MGILTGVVASISIASTYHQLNLGVDSWWWSSFHRGGAIGIYLFLYSIFFYSQSTMEGSFQRNLFFSIMALVSYYVYIVFGGIGFITSWLFVRHLFSHVKAE